MTKLSVNINKIAVIRNSRGGDMPSVVEAALAAESFGAQGITVHPRPDGRHIRYDDVRVLSKVVATEFNIEGNPVESFVDLVLEVRPAQVTLVPDAPGAITSNAGWDTIANAGFLREVTAKFHSAGVRVSIFVDPVVEMVAGAAAVGVDRVELYTEGYARAYAEAESLRGKARADSIPGEQAGFDGETRMEAGCFDEEAGFGGEARKVAIAPYLAAAEEARRLGLGLNAGHDLNLENLKYFAETIPWTDEVSIGHALISDAIYLGLEKTVKRYLACL